MTAPVTAAADGRRSIAAAGLLRDFNDAGVLESSDVLVAQRITSLAKEDDERVALAIAFAVRAVRGGSVCVDLATVRLNRAGSGVSVDITERAADAPVALDILAVSSCGRVER